MGLPWLWKKGGIAVPQPMLLRCLECCRPSFPVFIFKLSCLIQVTVLTLHTWCELKAQNTPCTSPSFLLLFAFQLLPVSGCECHG